MAHFTSHLNKAPEGAACSCHVPDTSRSDGLNRGGALRNCSPSSNPSQDGTFARHQPLLLFTNALLAANAAVTGALASVQMQLLLLLSAEYLMAGICVDGSHRDATC